MPALLTRIAKHGLTHAILWTYLLYLCIITLVIAPYTNWLASEVYRQETGRELHFEAIHINPFALSLTLRNASDKNLDGSALWSVENIYINLSLVDSLISVTPTIEEIRIDKPRISPERLTDGQWNFADILRYQATNAKNLETNTSAQNASLPALVIKQLHIAEGNLQIQDNNLKKPINIALDSFSFVMENFSTRSTEKQPYLLRATIINADKAKTSGELLWQGNIFLHEGFDQGTIAVKNFLLASLWPYTKPHFNFTLHTASASMTGKYNLQWKNALDWSIRNGELQLDNIGLTSGKKTTRNAELTAKQLSVSKINISNNPQTVAIDAITLDGLHLTSWSDQTESGVIRAFMPNASSATTDATETPLVTIGSLIVKKSAINWRVAELDQHTFQVRKLKLKAEPIVFGQEAVTTVKITSTIDETIKFSADGNINLNTLDGNINSELQQFPLTLIKSLVTSKLNIKDLSGTLDTKTRMAIDKGNPTTINTEGKITDLELHPLTAGQELLTWGSLAWDNTQVDLPGQKIDIPLVTLSKLDGWVIISKEGKTNIQKLFTETPHQESTTSDNNWQFDLHKLSLDKASFRFHDESLTPNFTAAVQNFSGDLINLSSDTSKLATFLFNGDVDGYAPVKLQGKTQPFLTQPLMDAQLDFENMDLGGFSGYSSTYAGWHIERGLLTANLHYRLNDGLIEGDNHIEMDQLQLGERVRNSTAMDIPLRLALALITDENGIATLDIGVSGKTDDPNFNVGKVIRSAVRNTFKKIVKSPFKLLAKLVGTKEDLGELPFNSGSSKLLGKATRRLNALQEAMNKRPELRIELRGSYDPASDTRGLQITRINQALQDNGLSSQDIKAKNQRWQAAVAREYRQLDLPQEKNISTEKMYERLLQSVAVAPESLTQLAATRSINAKQFLVQHLKIDNNRVLINASQDCEKPKDCNRRRVKIELSDISQISFNETTPPPN